MTSGRIMVVDDDREIRESFIEALEEHGYRTIGAANGREALEVLATPGNRPCLILLDLMMPTMDGKTFREAQLRDSALAAIPVVVMSAYRDVTSTASGVEAAAHIRKPVKLAELLRVARQHCGPGEGSESQRPRT
jgi:CheY-like chemotaxis protein